MADPTPSPSAEELADEIERAAGEPGSPLPSLNAIGRLFKLARQTIPFLRRLAETERERDEARQRLIFHDEVVELAKETMAKLIAAEAERDALREMLVQADAAHDPEEPRRYTLAQLGQWRKEAVKRARHRQCLSSPSTPATPDSKRDE